MSGLSYVNNRGMVFNPPGIMSKIKKYVKALFETTGGFDEARVWHGSFSYKLVSGTSIKSLCNLSPVTAIDAGKCYVCVFDKPDYQGDYRIIGPGEKARVKDCNSIVTSSERISVEAIRSGGLTGEFWELDGPMYIMHFSSSYRYM